MNFAPLYHDVEKWVQCFVLRIFICSHRIFPFVAETPNFIRRRQRHRC